MVSAELAASLDETLRVEMERNLHELTLPDAPPLYLLRHHLALFDQVDAEASFGALTSKDRSPLNLMGVEVRVGSPKFDNTGMSSWVNGFGRRMLPLVPSAYSLRRTAWKLTDTSYKDAVDEIANKKATFTASADSPGDYTMGLVTVADTRSRELPAPGVLEDLAVRLSAAFPTDIGLEVGTVVAAGEVGDTLTLDTEGTHVWRSSEELIIRAMAHLRAPDGMLLTDHRSWIVRRVSDLPPLADMDAQIVEMAGILSAISESPVLDKEYVGPVLFEDEAAIELFRRLLVPQIEGSPDASSYSGGTGGLGDLEAARRDDARIGRRVLPPNWVVSDDPRRNIASPASYTHDMEGTPAQDVVVVRDGIVRTLLLGRVPRQGAAGTNGHARGAIGMRPVGRTAMMEVTPSKRLTNRKLRRAALRLAADYGWDYIMVVRRFQDDTVRGLASDFGSDDSSLEFPLPVELVRIYADGREESLRGGMFVGVERFALRDIVGAGSQVERSYLAPFQIQAHNFSPVVGMPTWLSVPEVLVGEMEILPLPSDPRNQRVLPMPGVEEARN